MEKDLAVLNSQQLPNGLFVAGNDDYDKIWIRDNVYVALALAEAGYTERALRIYSGLLGIIKRYEHLLTSRKYPENDAELLHPRFTINGDIVDVNWSNKQHDAVGALLFGVGRLYNINPADISLEHQELCQKLINYLETCKYYKDADNGMWEDPPMLHSSSLAACIKGIEEVSKFCTHNADYLKNAKTNLDKLLPAESYKHQSDMALLSLIWPYNYMRMDIVNNIEANLLKSRGVIRYIGDVYESPDSHEPQWVMGIPWLGIAHFELGNKDKAAYYLTETEKLYNEHGNLPESYIASNEECVHTPLAWSHAMALVLRVKLSKT